MSLISIIVPVYNAEKYLTDCLNSIVSQSYTNLEILLIDDGSTDRSGIICDEYAEKDFRIKVFHIENHGVSYARNIGLDNCSGDYVAFIDSDDTVEHDYICRLHEACPECEDLVLSNISDVFEKNNVRTARKIDTSNLTGDFYEDCYLLWQLLRFPVIKLYKLSIIRDNAITFDTEMSFGEDDCFNINYYKYVSKYAYIHYAGYNYYHRENNSLSRRFSEETFVNDIKVLFLTNKFVNMRKLKCAQYIVTFIALECTKIVLNVPGITKENMRVKLNEIHHVSGNNIVLLPICMNNSWKSFVLNFFLKYKIVSVLWLCSKMINLNL